LSESESIEPGLELILLAVNGEAIEFSLLGVSDGCESVSGLPGGFELEEGAEGEDEYEEQLDFLLHSTYL
jgi:hypothetical protein